ncbi:MAG: WG repeat-containing protein [Dysgonomonas sp.]|nr:WG repeat-containing protein [Dysgonomonas sp.]
MRRGILHALSFLYLCLFFSCASYKKFDYAAIDSVKSLEGIYQNENYAISGGLNANDYSQKLWFKEKDVFKIEFPDSKTLNLSYLSDTGWKFRKSYKGKYNQKKNTFDIWHSRQIWPFVIFIGYRFEKVRIGKDGGGSLVVNHANDNMGMLIPLMAAGDRYSHIKKISLADKLSYVPFYEKKEWGYTDMDGNILIEARYDSVSLFEGDIARVNLNGKWGVIDRTGKEITPFKYSRINPIGSNIYTSVFSEENKEGLILRDGTETIEPIYDKIEFHFEDELVLIYQEGNQGIANIYGVIYPPIFNQVLTYGKFEDHLKKELLRYIAKVSFRGELFAADADGYLYNIDYGTLEDRVMLDSKIHYTELLKKTDYIED